MLQAFCQWGVDFMLLKANAIPEDIGIQCHSVTFGSMLLEFLLILYRFCAENRKCRSN